MPNLPLAPLASGTWQAGRWQTAAHWLCRGLRIATRARPPRLTCGATGVSLSPFTDHGEAVFAALSVEWIARYNLPHLAGGWFYVMALLWSRFLLWERASVLSIQLSRCCLINQTKQSRSGCFGIFHDLGQWHCSDFSEWHPPDQGLTTFCLSNIRLAEKSPRHDRLYE